ncbi:MAG: ribonuclease T [Gammaproteobacteria bacterium]|nr:MAG: ribonuclease T [Gammaproteobacteria bacterium]
MEQKNDAVQYDKRMARRFRGYLPVVVDVETGGFDASQDALLEVAAVTLRLTPSGHLEPAASFIEHVLPFEGANLDPKALEFTGIDPWHPLRLAKPEKDALSALFSPVRAAVKASGCKRAILVGHNAFFDLAFLNAAVARCNHKRNPFHPFSTFDTVTLAGMAYGQTVLAKAVKAAGMEWDTAQAHGALYDAEMTARLFCKVINDWQDLGAPQPWLESAEEAPRD